MKNIVALVTLFNPNENNVKNMLNLSKQVTNIVLLDNTNVDNRRMFSDIANVIYIPNLNNLGLSLAFNKGLQLEIVKHSDYVIFFDQDSLIPEGFIEKLVYDYCFVSNSANIGCMGPQYYDTNSKRVINPNSKKEIQNGMYSVNTIITSSMLTTYSVMNEIGFWNEDVFLDMADWDICWRMEKQGYTVVLDTNLTLTHTLGKGIKKIFGIKLRINNPIREYYQIRDSIKLCRKNYIPLKYRIRFLIQQIIMPPIYVLVFPEKRQRIKFIFMAYIDGFLGKNSL